MAEEGKNLANVHLEALALHLVDPLDPDGEAFYRRLNEVTKGVPKSVPDADDPDGFLNHLLRNV